MTALDLARAAKGRTALLAAGALVFNALVWGVSWWPFRQLQGHGLHPLWATALMYLMIATGLLVLQFERGTPQEKEVVYGQQRAETTAAAARLGGAATPVLLVGGGARAAAAEVRALAERLGAPVVTTANGKGVLPEDHPLALGAGIHLAAVADLVAGADVVVAIGTELAPSDLWNGPLPIRGLLVRIDVDPVAIVTNVVPDVALVGDAALTVSQLLDNAWLHLFRLGDDTGVWRYQPGGGWLPATH